MFGVGRTVKRWKYNFNCFSEETIERIRNPEALLFYKSLQMESNNLDYFLNILPRQDLIYIEIPKAACTTIKMALSHLCMGKLIDNPNMIHKRKYSGLMNARQVGLSNFYNIVHNSNPLIFTFVRNPYKRIVSCYKDKFSNQPLGKLPRYQKIIRNTLGDDRNKNFDLNKPLPLTDFVDMACRSNKSGIDGHWGVMADIIPLNTLNKLQIYRVENFVNDFTEVLDCAGIPRDKQKTYTQTRFNKSQTDRNKRILLTDSMVDKISSAYKIDFENFGYTIAPPSDLVT